MPTDFTGYPLYFFRLSTSRKETLWSFTISDIYRVFLQDFKAQPIINITYLSALVSNFKVKRDSNLHDSLKSIIATVVEVLSYEDICDGVRSASAMKT